MSKKILMVLSILALAGINANALTPDAPTVLITGSNHGIGLELARQYADKGWNVIATARRPTTDPAMAELNKIVAAHPKSVVIERIDVTDTAMIKGVAEKYKDQAIDILINNAANVEPNFAADMAKVGETYDKVDFDASRRDFDVNTIGPMRLAQAFMPHVIRSKQKKIINVSSSAGSLVKPMAGAMALNYGASKAGLNKYSQLLSVGVKDKGVIVAIFQPIFVASKDDLKGTERAKNADPVIEIAKFIKEAENLTMERSGKITNWSSGNVDPF